MILGLALIPSKSFQEAVDSYRKRYDKQYSRIKPHVTIKAPFEIKDGDLDSVIEQVRARINGIPAVEVHATKASFFAFIIIGLMENYLIFHLTDFLCTKKSPQKL